MRRLSQPFLLTVALAVAAALPAAAPAAVYVTSDESDVITAFDRGAQSGPGALAELDEEVTAEHPLGIAVSPDGRRVYVAQRDADSIGVYAAAADGSLTALPAAGAASGDAPVAVAVSPSGRHLFSADEGGTVSAFAIAADGSLAAVAGSPFAAGSQPSAIAISPAGGSLYVTDAVDHTVSAFAIGAGGALSPLGVQSAGGDGPGAATILPDGSRLYVANTGSDSISRFAIAADGQLGAAVDQPATGAEPVALAIAPGGGRLLAGLRGDDRIAVFSIGAGGALAPVSGSPFPTLDGPAALAVFPGGRQVYATETSGPEIAAHAISPGGALSPVGGSPFSDGSAGHGAGSVAITPEQAPIASFAFSQPNDRDLVVDFDGSSAFDPDGAIAYWLWDFGDGETLAGPARETVSHVYGGPGRYDVSLSVVDGAGCGASLIFTGQTALCNGGPEAIAEAEVIVARPGVLNPYLEVDSPQKLGRKLKVKLKAGAGEDVTVLAGGKVTAKGGGSVRLAKLRTEIEGSDRKVLRLKPKDKGDAARLLARGEKLKAKIKVKFTDVPGSKATERAAVSLRPKR